MTGENNTYMERITFNKFYVGDVPAPVELEN